MGEEEIIALRTTKLERLRSRGIDPYPARFRPSHSARQAVELLEGRDESAGPVTVAGRITAMRQMGKASFIDLRDGSGRIQAYVKEDIVGAEAYETLRDIDLGDFLGIRGPLFRTKTGEPTVQVGELTLLAQELRAPPEKWHGLQDIEVRYRQRYMDLVANQEAREAFITRSRGITAVRHFPDERR